MNRHAINQRFKFKRLWTFNVKNNNKFYDTIISYFFVIRFYRCLFITRRRFTSNWFSYRNVHHTTLRSNFQMGKFVSTAKCLAYRWRRTRRKIIRKRLWIIDVGSKIKSFVASEQIHSSRSFFKCEKKNRSKTTESVNFIRRRRCHRFASFVLTILDNCECFFLSKRKIVDIKLHLFWN